MRFVGSLLVLLAATLLGGCTTTSLIASAAGVATDTSIAWAVIKHVHQRVTDGDPTPCMRLDPLDRALAPRCGDYTPGTLKAADLAAARLPECALTLAARDERLWPVLPDLVSLGALPEACRTPPLVALAQAQAALAEAGCVDFTRATPAARQALQWLGEADARAVHHDVMRIFTCPQGRAAGLDKVVEGWLARGDLAPGLALPFSPMSALHPTHLGSELGRALRAQGHTAQAALGSYAGQLPGGFDLALRLADRPAIQWWLSEAPVLANRVPPAHSGELAWVPLARVLRDGYLADPANQRPLVELLLANGASPSQRLPYEPDLTVLGYAVRTSHPLRALLDAPGNFERLADAAPSSR
jgi:hypothetical protein